MARGILGSRFGAQQHSRGDQANQAAADDHRTRDVSKVLRLIHCPEESVARGALQRLHVKLYHCETERLQSFLPVVGGGGTCLQFGSTYRPSLLGLSSMEAFWSVQQIEIPFRVFVPGGGSVRFVVLQVFVGARLRRREGDPNRSFHLLLHWVAHVRQVSAT